MEDLSIHAAALKAIEWFGLNPDSMSAKAEEGAAPKAEGPKTESSSSPGTTAKKSDGEAETNGPNKPLKFRLDKLEREHPYLVSRGLTSETILDFGVGYCSKGMMAERIAIPIHNPQGEVVAYAGRFPGNPEEGTAKYKLPPGFRKSLELFNIDRAIKEPAEKPLVIVEGFFDCMKLHQHGCRKVVALMGSTLSAAQDELIRKHTDRKSQVIVMLDEDEAGKAGRDDIAARLAKFVFVKVHTFDKDGRQPADLSPEEVLALLA
jgi:DNA primase